MKRILCLLMCAAMLCAVGCAKSEPQQKLTSFTAPTGVKLTPEQYKTALEERWDAYMDAGMDYSATMPEKIEDSDEPHELAKLSDEVDPILDYMEEVLCSYDEIIPPDEYKELNEKLLEGIDTELEWLESRRKHFHATTQEELDAAREKEEEIINTATDNGTSYPMAYFNVYMKLKDDGFE